MNMNNEQVSGSFRCLSLDSSPVPDGGSETDKAAADGPSAVGSAMGMLSSLTSVVQSTVSGG